MIDALNFLDPVHSRIGQRSEERLITDLEQILIQDHVKDSGVVHRSPEGDRDEDNRIIKGVLGQGADTFWLRSFQNIINKQFPEYAPEELVEWKETQDQSLQQEGAERKADIRKQLRILLFARLEKVYGAKWLNNVAILKNAIEGRIIKEFGDNDDFDLSEYDWRDYLEVSEYRDVIDKNFSYQEFEEVFAINIGLAFKSKKDKLNWMSMISEPKGKKTSALTRSDLNRLELVNTHLANFIDVE